MASYGMNDVKNGMKILVNGDPAIIVDTEYVKPGKGQAFTRVKYRMIKSGRVQERWDEHTSELKSLMRIASAVLCFKKKQPTLNTQSEQYSIESLIRPRT